MNGGPQLLGAFLPREPNGSLMAEMAVRRAVGFIGICPSRPLMMGHSGRPSPSHAAARCLSASASSFRCLARSFKADTCWSAMVFTSALLRSRSLQSRSRFTDLLHVEPEISGAADEPETVDVGEE